MPFAVLSRCFVAAIVLALSVTLMACPVNQPPLAAFRANLGGGAAPLTVQFTDLSLPGGASINRWEWDFGDGAGSTDRHPQHTYEANGVYDVSLTVSTRVGEDSVTHMGLVQVGLQFQLIVVNTGDYPIRAVHVAKANATSLGADRLGPSLPPGREATISRPFTKSQHIVLVKFDVGGVGESHYLYGNLYTRGMPDDFATLYAGRAPGGGVVVDYAWGPPET